MSATVRTERTVQAFSGIIKNIFSNLEPIPLHKSLDTKERSSIHVFL